MNSYHLLAKEAAEFPTAMKPTGSDIRSLLPGSLGDGAVMGGVGGAALGGLAGGAQALFDGEDDGIGSTLSKILGGAGKGAVGGAVVGGGAAAYQRHNAGKKLRGIADYFRAAMEEKRKEIRGAKPQVSLEQLIQQAKQKAGDASGFRGGDPSGTHPGMLRKEALAKALFRGAQGAMRAPGDFFHAGLGFMNGGGKGFAQSMKSRGAALSGLGRAGQVGNLVGTGAMAAGALSLPIGPPPPAALGINTPHPDWQRVMDQRARNAAPVDHLPPLTRTVVEGIKASPIGAALPNLSDLPSGFQQNKLLQMLRGNSPG